MEFSPGDPLSARSLDKPEREPKDTDLTHDSPHHTIGYGPTQAAAGVEVLRLKARVAALEKAAKAAGWQL